MVSEGNQIEGEGVEGSAEADALAQLRQALEDLRVEIRTSKGMDSHRSGFGNSAEWSRLFDELRKRLGRFGMGERGIPSDDFGLDRDALERAEPVFEFMRERYWRVEIEGAQRVPHRGPCLFVANRSGLLPYDGLMLAHLLESLGHARSRTRFLVEDELVSQPFAQAFLARLGGVRACRENVDRLLRDGHSVIAFPEGGQGASKMYRDRYRLAPFDRRVVIGCAVASGATVVPVGIVGAEEAHPLLAKLPPPKTSSGLPFIPVTPTFPWFGLLGLLPLPSKWIIQFGDPIGGPQGEPDGDDEVEMSRAAENLRSSVQALVERALGRRSSVWS